MFSLQGPVVQCRQDNFVLKILDLPTPQPLGQEVFDSIIFMSVIKGDKERVTENSKTGSTINSLHLLLFFGCVSCNLKYICPISC